MSFFKRNENHPEEINRIILIIHNYIQLVIKNLKTAIITFHAFLSGNSTTQKSHPFRPALISIWLTINTSLVGDLLVHD